MLTLALIPEETRKQMEAAATPETVMKLQELLDRAMLLMPFDTMARMEWSLAAAHLSDDLFPATRGITADGDGHADRAGHELEAAGV
jgi:hypothetical protein